MSISKGVNFASTEQVTNTKLNNLVDNATISLEHSELAASMLSSLATASGSIPIFMFATSMASGATLTFDGGTGVYGV